MKLTNKIFVALLVAGILPLLISVFIVEKRVVNTIEAKDALLMDSVTAGRKSHLEEFLDGMEKQFVTIATIPETEKAVINFSKAFKGIGNNKFQEDLSTEINESNLRRFYSSKFARKMSDMGENTPDVLSLMPRTKAGLILQDTYIASNPEPLGSKNNLVWTAESSPYALTHKKYHSLFNSWIQSTGFYDLFLVDPESGVVVYSTYKEIDFATSLKDGPHSQSGLGKSFRMALDNRNGNSNQTDIEPYLPSYNAGASFYSKAIISEGKVVGVVIAQLPLDYISEVVVSKKNLGESARAYLVGADGLLRTKLVDGENTRGLLENSDVSTKEIADTGGDTVGHIVTDSNGNEFTRLIVPLNVSDLGWYQVVEVSNAASAAESSHLQKMFIFLCLVSGLISLAIAYFFTRGVQKELGADPVELKDIFARLAEGDLDQKLDTKHSTSLLAVINEMKEKLRQRDAEDAEDKARIVRLRDGLDKLDTVVILADEQGNLRFVNQAMKKYFDTHAAGVRSLYPDFTVNDFKEANLFRFFSDATAVKNEVDNSNGGCKKMIKCGDRDIFLVISATYNDEQQHIGYSLEWVDVTEERQIVKAVEEVVNAAKEGNLHVRIDQTKYPGYAAMSEGINGLLDITSEVTGELKVFLGAIAVGDLSKSINGDLKGEFGELKRDANTSVTRLRDVVKGIRTIAGNVDVAAREISTGNDDLSRRTESVAASLEETSSNMEEMTGSVSQNARNAKDANELAEQARDKAQQGGQVVGEAVKAMNGINDSSRKIADIIGVIDDIAFQTNLLALNASVEAARAGEQGRGFAVVASEVRNLAGRSATAAKEIKELIEDSVSRVENGAELVNESGSTLEEIVNKVKNVADIVSEITSSSQEQAEGISSVNKAISQLDSATQQNAALVEQAATASRSASEQAAELIQQVKYFSQGEGDIDTDLVSIDTSRDLRSPLASNSDGIAANAPMVVQVANSDTDPDWEEF